MGQHKKHNSNALGMKLRLFSTNSSQQSQKKKNTMDWNTQIQYEDTKTYNPNERKSLSEMGLQLATFPPQLNCHVCSSGY